ncbi:hypothetical protein DFS34DRAFT_72657 [Phlyctochytrium arcticum]|nr:hypothetical protein DFS34DRAFT_72657 [Phlyctochytrium arcticum]
MTKFRPCIDLHDGQVKQIVGASLSSTPSTLQTNFTSTHPPSHYANLYKHHSLTGSHVIKLGPNNDTAAIESLQAWPGYLQIGGGITASNAAEWIERGAAKVIVTSYLFPDATFSLERLQDVSRAVGKDCLVVDLSCKRVDGTWVVAMNKWQTCTDTQVNKETMDLMAPYCSEFLIHAADVEGLCQGIDADLVKCLGEWTPIPCTYAGGAKDLSDLDLVQQLSNGKVDLTFGSALDIFGGSGVKFEEACKWNREHVR